MWQEPIFDRTNADTLTARAGQSNIDNHKGALNYQDLNRIEGNFQYVVDKLFENSMVIPHRKRNYTETVLEYVQVGEEITVNPEPGTDPAFELIEITTTYTDWQEQNIPWLSEIDRIRQNFNNLVNLFLHGLNLPIFYSSPYLMYDEVNDWERVLSVGKEMYTNMRNEFRRCNAYDCGGSDVDWMPYEKNPVRSAVLGVGVLSKMMIGKEE